MPTVRAIFEEHVAYVWKTLRRLGVAPTDLEDMAHEVFIRVHRRLSSYDETRPIKPWLCAITYRVVQDARRARGRRIETKDDDQDLAAHDPTFARIAAASTLHRALEEVEGGRRIGVVMHHLDGFSAPEIAVELGLGVEAVYGRLRTGREELRLAVHALHVS